MVFEHYVQFNKEDSDRPVYQNANMPSTALKPRTPTLVPTDSAPDVEDDEDEEAAALLLLAMALPLDEADDAAAEA